MHDLDYCKKETSSQFGYLSSIPEFVNNEKAIKSALDSHELATLCPPLTPHEYSNAIVRPDLSNIKGRTAPKHGDDEALTKENKQQRGRQCFLIKIIHTERQE